MNQKSGFDRPISFATECQSNVPPAISKIEDRKFGSASTPDGEARNSIGPCKVITLKFSQSGCLTVCTAKTVRFSVSTQRNVLRFGR